MSLRGRERLVLDIFAVDLRRKSGRHRLLEQETLLLIGQRITRVAARIAAHPVRRLNVVGVRRHGFDDPLMAIGRLPARRVESITQGESFDDVMHVSVSTPPNTANDASPLPADTSPSI